MDHGRRGKGRDESGLLCGLYHGFPEDATVVGGGAVPSVMLELLLALPDRQLRRIPHMPKYLSQKNPNYISLI